jgi:uncharacterized membrane protein
MSILFLLIEAKKTASRKKKLEISMIVFLIIASSSLVYNQLEAVSDYPGGTGIPVGYSLLFLLSYYKYKIKKSEKQGLLSQFRPK